MAEYRAISVLCETVVRMLESEYTPARLDGTTLTFAVYGAADFQSPMEPGVSLYLHRVTTNAAQRTPPSRILEPGKRRRPQLPLEAHFLLTAWARRPVLQQGILGWAMRVMEDHAIIPAAVLGGIRPDIFAADEFVELVPSALTIDEMARVWDGLPADYQISVPYVARMLRVESLVPPVPFKTVELRHVEAHDLHSVGAG